MTQLIFNKYSCRCEHASCSSFTKPKLGYALNINLHVNNN